MRRVIWVAVALAALWCAWWAGAAYFASSGVAAWFDARRAEGWQAELSDIKQDGFPDKIRMRLQNPELADPQTGLAIALEYLTISARALWPGDMTVILPKAPIRVATPEQTWVLHVENGRALMNLHPGTAGELENLSADADAIQIETGAGTSVAGAANLDLRLAQTTSAETYMLTFEATNFAPGELVRDALALHPDWPPFFDTLIADLSIQLDRPIDRRALEQRRPQPVVVKIKQIDAKWGDMRFLATGAVTANARQQAEGTLTIKAENWLKMVDLAEASGLLPSDFRPQVEAILSSLAAGTGKTTDLDLTLRFADGTTKVGFLPLGPAPSLAIR